MTQDKTALLPCPFCGIAPDEIVDATKILGVYRIIHRCKVIPPFTMEESTPDRLAAAWNTRPVAAGEARPLDDYIAIHDAAAAAYAAATPSDYRYSATALRKFVDAALERAALRSLPPDDGFVVVPKARLEGLEHAVEFACRWTWHKEGNGTSDAERLEAIKHHPVIAARSTP